MIRPKVLIPMPSYGFDPSEVAIPWKFLTDHNFEVVFITPDGNKATTDEIMLNGTGLGIWKQLLKARQDAVDAHNEMITKEEFIKPLSYSDVNEDDYDALLLPGGHDKRVREYMESEILQSLIVDFFKANKPVAAICHGVVLVARSMDPSTQKSVLYDYKTTGLLKRQEMMGYNLTRLWMKDYYLTYPDRTVESEVKALLSDPDNFKQGPLPVLRDDEKHMGRGFTVRDRNYLSARWPGDLYNFSLDFIKLVEETRANS